MTQLSTEIAALAALNLPVAQFAAAVQALATAWAQAQAAAPAPTPAPDTSAVPSVPTAIDVGGWGFTTLPLTGHTYPNPQPASPTSESIGGYLNRVAPASLKGAAGAFAMGGEADVIAKERSLDLNDRSTWPLIVDVWITTQLATPTLAQGSSAVLVGNVKENPYLDPTAVAQAAAHKAG
jgi:hypothetical protein